MKEHLKHILRKWPAFYRLVETSYYTLRFRRLKEHLSGTIVIEKEWATRHLRKERKRDDWAKGGREWIKSYWNSQDHSHRLFLIERISKFSPNSILEIGCNCGPNLYLLAKKFPDAEIRGIDINPLAVQKGNEWLAQEGISNVKLLEGKADELMQFHDKSFDIVFADAVLIYIGPDKIKEVMGELIRITHKALILMEWRSFEPDHKDPYGIGIYYHGNWKRDYVALLKQFVPEEQIHVTKITKDVWPEKNWKEVGGVIEVVIEQGVMDKNDKELLGEREGT
jgi:ubiquinone/menaquinone biosynthesis C-methylase UbiE